MLLIKFPVVHLEKQLEVENLCLPQRSPIEEMSMKLWTLGFQGLPSQAAPWGQEVADGT